MKILIETIPHKDQRYPTVGDWYWKSSRTQDFDDKGIEGALWDPRDTLVIRVSAMRDWRYEALVAIHEVTEALLCKYAGITEAEVDAFDLSFEHRRPKGDPSDPGDDSHAPYYHEHKVASAIESRLAGELEINWDAYEAEVDSL